ncbi:hypothetical protein [Oceanobacillus kimchii]|uniref:Uncharacterized protein n=1 Tax=Oceanobacillus kimchii TaxID=746691 RepID=A0ABQ5TH65_9BACI|nr:hypothetical protein [Oceanobacillus kimchii]GLO66218.1 hypothetical protein MACH08_20020 [Oceanobacillus kimchii]
MNRIHETRKECFKRTKLFGKILYLTGTIKMIPNAASRGGKTLYSFKFRAVHPLTWIMAISYLLVSGFNKESLSDIKDDTTLI